MLLILHISIGCAILSSINRGDLIEEELGKESANVTSVTSILKGEDSDMLVVLFAIIVIWPLFVHMIIEENDEIRKRNLNYDPIANNRRRTR
jgi:hypothetical protein